MSDDDPREPAMAALTRPSSGKMIAGVCAGIAERFGVSVTLVRLFFVVFAITGIGELAYLALWIIVPKSAY